MFLIGIFNFYIWPLWDTKKWLKIKIENFANDVSIINYIHLSDKKEYEKIYTIGFRIVQNVSAICTNRVFEIIDDNTIL